MNKFIIFPAQARSQDNRMDILYARHHEARGVIYKTEILFDQNINTFLALYNHKISQSFSLKVVNPAILRTKVEDCPLCCRLHFVDQGLLLTEFSVFIYLLRS